MVLTFFKKILYGLRLSRRSTFLLCYFLWLCLRDLGWERSDVAVYKNLPTGDSLVFYCVTKKGSGNWYPSLRLRKKPFVEMFTLKDFEACSKGRKIREWVEKELPLYLMEI